MSRARSRADASGGDPLDPDRARLFAIAYRMLGSVADAEDVLQDASLKLAAAPPLGSRAAWLTTVVTRLSIDKLKSAVRERESYVGPWLPEPLLTDAEHPAAQDDRVGLAESVSLAFLTLLERLSPLERAAFLLHEVFGAPFAEVAQVLERDPGTCRQLYHRAEAHLAAGRRRFDATSDAHVRIVGAFITAVSTGDVAALEELLAEEAVSLADGGGRRSSARRPVRGRRRVARFVLGLAKRGWREVHVEVRSINAEPGLVLRWAGEVMVVALEVSGERIRAVRFVRNPDKLRHLA